MGSDAGGSPQDELNEIWDDDQSEASVGGGPAQHDLGTGLPLRNPGVQEQLATISEPEGEEHDFGDSSSEVDTDEDVLQQAQRYRKEGSMMSQSLSGGYLASMAGAGSAQSHLTAPHQPTESTAIPVLAATRDSPTSTVQLGTSVPINIPMSAGNRRYVEMAGEDKRFASTFVPPHLMEQRTAEEVSGAITFSGVSPSASLKRERLVQRNAILRSTGFIESTGFKAGGFVETLDPIKEIATRGGRGSLPLPLERPVEASALSKALDTMVGAAGGSAA